MNTYSSSIKGIILFLLIITSTLLQKTFAQDSSYKRNVQLGQLLTSYYSIKDALVAGKADSASVGAIQFIRSANGIDYKIISEGNINRLLKDAGMIAEAQDIKKQRTVFANLSLNMYEVAKAVKLSEQPIYQAYCPMKKTYWLSNEKVIRNPYYGSSMLTCGKVTETLQ